MNYGLLRRIKVARYTFLQLLKDRIKNNIETYEEEFIRASGDCICEICNEKYYDHLPKFFKVENKYEIDFLHIRCDRQRLKL